MIAGCHGGGSSGVAASGGVTDIAITSTVIQNGVKRLGMNIGGQNYYDSGQMLRNLTFNNPGFEGETWQSILRCKVVTATSCTDGNQWTQWPADFLKDAQFDVISGVANGSVGTVITSLPADPQQQDHGVTIKFAALGQSIRPGDFVLVKKAIPGNAQAGWWTDVSGGASVGTEFKDLAPNSPGKQALKLSASGPGQTASVSSYFDSMEKHSFVQLKGRFRLTFRARGAGGTNQLTVYLRRMTPHDPEEFMRKVVPLQTQWHDYSYDFSAAENGKQVGTVALSFYIGGADVLLDDVSLVELPGALPNPTAFRDAVLATLQELHPGILRYHDGDHLGSTIDNMIAPAFARVRAGYSERVSVTNTVPLGLPEFLQLCQAVDAEPWFNMPASTSPAEAKNLIEYLAGPASSPYGARRAKLGQAAPWTSVFRTIHLELGNEEWNAVTFAGSAMPDPVAYGQRAKAVFQGARSSPFYQPAKFDLVLGSFALIPDWTQRELSSSGGYDSTAVGPYIYDKLEDDSSDEAIFGPMLAAPEMVDSRPAGYMMQQAKIAQAGHTALSVYEVNLGTASGSAPQSSFDLAVPSMGAGLTLIDHMLLMLRDLGVKNQSVWELPGYSNSFHSSYDNKEAHTALYGVVIDMGGPTNLRRPQYFAEELANQAMLSNMLGTRLTGYNPTWNQPHSENDNVQLDGAHMLQTFAFADGNKRSLIVLNLSRLDPLPVTFSGNAPVGNVDVSRLTADNITDSNETGSHVAITKFSLSNFNARTPLSLPPFSMTVLQWTAQ